MKVEINGISYVPATVVSLEQQPFSVLLRRAREAHGESLDVACSAIGISKTYLWQLEKGEAQPGLIVLQSVLNHFGLRFEQIAHVQDLRREG